MPLGGGAFVGGSCISGGAVVLLLLLEVEVEVEVLLVL
jgi:hypothetical protein